MTETRKLKLSWQMKAVAAALVIFPALSLTTSIVQRSSVPHNSRGIASVGEEPVQEAGLDSASMDLSSLSNLDLRKAFKYQLLRDARAQRFQDSLSVTLGLFMVGNPAGGKVNVCDRYPQIEITMKSEKMQRTFQSDCKVSDDMSHIEAVSLNMENPEHVRWNIIGVRLLSENKEDIPEVSAKDLHAVLGNEIAIEDIR